MFRLSARGIFATWSQATNLSFSDLIAHCHEQLCFDYAIFCQETHQDGNQHYHAFIYSKKKFDIRNPRILDCSECHPKIETSRNHLKTINYCRKEGSYEEYGEYSADIGTLSIAEPGSFSSELEWLMYCLAQRIPFGYASRIWQIDQQQGSPIIEKNSRPIGTETHSQSLLSSWLRNVYDGRPTVLCGPPGLGKTQTILNFATPPILFVSHVDSLKHLNDSINSIVFDDMDFKHYPTGSQIHLVDYDQTRCIHIRYSIATIPAKIQKFFISNDYMFANHGAITRRTNYLYMEEDTLYIDNYNIINTPI